MQKLAAFPEVECKIFNLEKPGTEQDLAAGSFDFIIGTNVLHAVSEVRVTLGDGSVVRANAADGFLSFENDNVTIVARDAELVEH